MFIVQAPYPAVQTTVILPSAELGNQRRLSSSVQTIRAMNGTLYTYVKSKRARKVHQWDVLASKAKCNEVKEFVRRYAGDMVLVTDHNNEQYVGFLTMNPIELRGEGRAEGWPSGEAYSFSIQLEEKV